jgi:hypothetical protein
MNASGSASRITPPGAEPSGRPPETAPEPAPAPRAEALIQSVLDSYRQAYNNLDARAVEVVWPGVNTKTLSKAFDGLSNQEVTFDHCSIDVTSTFRAEAACSGRAAYVPKVGNKSEHVQSRQWTFHLWRLNGLWLIDTMQIK